MMKVISILLICFLPSLSASILDTVISSVVEELKPNQVMLYTGNLNSVYFKMQHQPISKALMKYVPTSEVNINNYPDYFYFAPSEEFKSNHPKVYTDGNFCYNRRAVASLHVFAVSGNDRVNRITTRRILFLIQKLLLTLLLGSKTKILQLIFYSNISSDERHIIMNYVLKLGVIDTTIVEINSNKFFNVFYANPYNAPNIQDVQKVSSQTS